MMLCLPDAVPARCRALQDAGVIGVCDEITGECPVAYVELADSGFDVQKLHHVLTEVASYKKPREFITIDKVPRSGSGKVLRKMLKATYQQGTPPPTPSKVTPSLTPGSKLDASSIIALIEQVSRMFLGSLEPVQRGALS